jgi:hypothetical protein
LGSNGSMRCHSPSGTIHGGCSPRLTAPHRRSTSLQDERPKIIFVRNSKRKRHPARRGEAGLTQPLRTDKRDCFHADWHVSDRIEPP